MYKEFFIAAVSLLFLGCQNNSPKHMESDSVSDTVVSSDIINTGSDVAVQFINDYINDSNKGKHGAGIEEFVLTNLHVTKKFKDELIRILDEAEKSDPGYGLGFDPIFNAQDYDESGMEAETIDDKQYIVVSGKKWKDFKITLKIIYQNKKWLVDGCGIVNIPDDKQVYFKNH